MQFSHDERGSGWVGAGGWVMEGFKKYRMTLKCLNAEREKLKITGNVSFEVS